MTDLSLRRVCSAAQLLLLAGTALQLGCSALVDSEPRQCSNDADCLALGAGFENTTCDAEKRICTASAAAAPMCTKHSDCGPTVDNKRQVCTPDGRCAALFSRECTSVTPERAELRDDMFLVGFMGLIEGPQASYGLAQKSGVDLALRELAAANRLDAAPGTVNKRHLTVLNCNHGDDEGESAGKHLVNNLRVPAILGASYSGVTLKVFDIAKQQKTLVFSPAATSPQITTVVDPDNLLWRTVPSDLLQTEALKELVPRVGEAIVKKNQLGDRPAPVLAIPYKLDPAGMGLLDGVINGPKALSGALVPYDNPVPGQPEPNWDAVATRIVDLAPDIILHLGTGEFVEKVMPRIEDRWPAGRERPWYVVPEGDLEQLKLADTASFLQTRGIHERLVGTSPGSRRSADYRVFRIKFLPMEPGNLAEFAYDAVYLLAYAIGWTNKPAPTGLELAMGLTKTSCAGAPRINAGSLQFGTGWMEISRGSRCIDYVGASGDLNFSDRGEPESDMAVWCLQPATPSFNSLLIDTYYPIATRTLSPYMDQSVVDFSTSDWCKPALVPVSTP